MPWGLGGVVLNEWGFAAEVKTWWDGEFRHHPEWRFDRCEVEHRVDIGGGQRSDLTILGSGTVLLAGELRLPDHSVPSPWHPENLLNALTKATTLGARWAFTSDGVEFLLIDTARGGPPATRVVQSFQLEAFTKREELDSEAFLGSVRAAWLDCLRSLGPIAAGLAVAPGMAPDETFINSLRALLSIPVAAIRDELNRRRLNDTAFEHDLVVWMVDDQGWTHLPEHWENEVLRAAQLTAYVFSTRLMFYEALRRSNPALSRVDIPAAAARIAQATVRAFFEEARSLSGDYETLFTWDRAAEFALISDAAVPGWRRVLDHLTAFDVSHIGYDILGKMFERLIEPNERYRWGQHYTKPDVVDLMLSFAVPDGDGAVLDPAVGGGTFLVRAYVRKQVLNPGKSHQQILSELYGIDISAFAASLATVNLAVRQLEFSDNYPQVAARSFFQMQPSGVLLSIPAPGRVSLNSGDNVPVALNRVRAVVCNPPYVRLHELGEDRQEEAQRALDRRDLRIPPPAKLHGLSNYHLYFWFHGAQYLEDGGRLVLITSGEWLDSDYGVILQQWLLDHFAIECCIESLAEPWFSEARVGTVVVSARACSDDAERGQNLVRFVLLRKPLRELYGSATTDAEHLQRVDGLRDRLLSLTGVAETDDYDWSVVTQLELRQLGMA